MNYKSLIIIALLFIGVSLLIAQSYHVSIPPTPIMQSWYDYMIGGYNNSPVQVIPDAQGGGLLMTYHAQASPLAGRCTYLANINSAGVLVSLDSIMVNNTSNGHPSLDIDEVSGTAFVAWHSKRSDDLCFSVYGVFGAFNNGVFDTLSTHQPVFDSDSTGVNYQWPQVRFGPSPTAGMRRLYVLADKYNPNAFWAKAPKIAYSDFYPEQVDSTTVLNWNYLSIPDLEAWATDTGTMRSIFYSMVITENGSLYLSGYHESSYPDEGGILDEPNLDIWISDNYGTSPFRRVSIHSGQTLSCQFPEINDYVYFADILNSGHFNAISDSNSNLHFPLLSVVSIDEINTVTNDIQRYSIPTTYALRHIEFDTESESFRIDDLYPQGASPHADPAYTPWDINEDGQVDEYINGNPVYQTTWPFLHWNQYLHDQIMMYYYNLLQMTEPNHLGWMATVWQESNRARLYNQPSGSDWYPELAPFTNTPEIMVSLSPDNGYTWLPPVSLNNVETPALAGIKPMYVYPANKLLYQNQTGDSLTCRLYLMFYDDNTWGSYQLDLPVGPNDGGRVMYMAVDISMPYVANQDNIGTPSVITLDQNYPNPFNKTTEIKYSLTKDSEVRLSIYNTKGQLVKNLVTDRVKAGNQSISWNGEDNTGKRVSTGLYFYKLQTGEKSLTRKLLLLK